GTRILSRDGFALAINGDSSQVGHTTAVSGLAFLPGDDVLVTTGQTTLRWNAASCTRIAWPEQNASRVLAANTATVLLLGDRPNRALDAEGRVTTLEVGAISASQIAPDGAAFFFAT